MKKPLESSFEDYRRDRKFRRQQSSAPARPLGKNAAVLRELEQAEQAEIRSERLTREVHDFFADATRVAASIVNKISEAQEQVFEHQLSDEMREFLQDVILRAEAFMTALRSRQVSGGQEDLETNMQNLVGARLDGFRFEGTAQLEDKHIGEDPFDKPLPQADDSAARDAEPDEQALQEPRARPEDGRATEEPPPARPRPSAKPGKAARKPRHAQPAPAPAHAQPARPSRQQAQTPIAPPQPVTSAASPKPEPREATPAPEPPAANPAALLASLARDPARMRQALEILVSSGVLARDEATEMCRSLLGD